MPLSLGLPTAGGYPRSPPQILEPQRGSGLSVSRSPQIMLEFLNQKAGTTLWFGNVTRRDPPAVGNPRLADATPLA